jgi:Ca2+-binding RTX toxin-like protein
VIRAPAAIMLTATATESDGSQASTSAGLVLTSAGGVTSLAGTNGDQILLAANGATGLISSVGGADQLSASGSGNTLIAGTGADTLIATGSNNTLVASLGSTTMIDSGANGIYQYAAGDGAAIIINGSASSTTASNELSLGSGVTDNELWFQQSSNDLLINVIGTGSSIDIRNWFEGGGNQLQEIAAGGLEIDSQVAQLVQAMATYSANNPAFNPATATQMPNDPNLQSAIAAAWHH